MPTQLDHVSATVNGKSAYVYFISPTQINILTPPDAMNGPAQVVVTNNGRMSAAFTVQAQPISPSFFVFRESQRLWDHMVPLLSGSTLQGGTLSRIPVIKIGGVTAVVHYAGLVFPGEFQFNVTVPASLASGYQSITATYGGASTQSGTLITIQD